MSAETKQVLEMLAEGKITTGDAEKLLDKLSGRAAAPAGTPAAQSAPGDKRGNSSGASAKKQRYLRIQVEKPGRENVNMRVPLALARTSSLLALVPPRVMERLAEQGIDLAGFASLKEEELAETLEQMNIDIDKGNGKKVRIFCE
jgi:hypothetical protein